MRKFLSMLMLFPSIAFGYGNWTPQSQVGTPGSVQYAEKQMCEAESKEKCFSMNVGPGASRIDPELAKIEGSEIVVDEVKKQAKEQAKAERVARKERVKIASVEAQLDAATTIDGMRSALKLILKDLTEEMKEGKQ